MANKMKGEGTEKKEKIICSFSSYFQVIPGVSKKQYQFFFFKVKR